MVKAWNRILLLMVLLLFTSGGACAEHAWVIDDASLYSADEIAQMEQLIESMVRTYQMDIGVLTTNDVPYASGNDHVTVDYADTYYENNGYGLGEDRAGVLFILDMTNRYNYLSTAGTMADYLTDNRIGDILSSADDYLYSGRYGTAMLSQLTMLQRFLKAGIEEGSFRYDAATGERLSGIYNRLTQTELLVSILAGAAVALGMYLIVSATYRLAGKTYRYALDERNVHVDMLRDDEQFIRERVTRVPIPKVSGGGGGRGGGGGGSGMHTSSGGMSHGGGGHHF